jgi:hypothetical protein
MFLILIFGFTYALFRELGEHAKDNRFPDKWGRWWNSDTSWTNKYRWFPSWFWKTAGVWATDAEHFFQLLATLSILLAFYFSPGGLDAVGLFYLGTIISGAFKELFLKNVQ